MSEYCHSWVAEYDWGTVRSAEYPEKREDEAEITISFWEVAA